jgi:two-component system CheB/CheR fusion protein
MAGKPRPATKPGRNMTDAVAIDAGQSLLLRSYAPNTLLLNASNELMHVFGDVGRYLRFNEGAVSLELAKLLPPQIAPVAQALLHKVARGGEPLRSDVLTLRLPDGESERLRLVVRQVELEQREPYLMLSFEPQAPEAGDLASYRSMETMDLDSETATRVDTLERELAATRESLQATIEELETANEELQATNEELMASNEELQSSNEELQSVNEELYTVNAENQEKIEILNRLNADLDGMAKAAAIATVFVDSDLRLTRFTPEATGLFKIRDGDLGRHIDDFSNLLNYPTFIEELRNTIISGEMLQREITAGNGRIYLVRVLPYAVRRGDPRGAVATFIDVTTLHDIKRLQAVLDSLPESVAVLDALGKITMVNAAWRKFARLSGDENLAEQGVGANYLDACESNDAAKDEQFRRDSRSGIESVLAGEKSEFSMKYNCHLNDPEHPDNQERLLVMHVSPIRHPAGGLIISHLDLTPSFMDQNAEEKG